MPFLSIWFVVRLASRIKGIRTPYCLETALDSSLRIGNLSPSSLANAWLVSRLSTLMPMTCAPRRMALSQQQPLIPGVLHQPAVQKGKVKRIAREFRRSQPSPSSGMPILDNR